MADRPHSRAFHSLTAALSTEASGLSTTLSTIVDKTPRRTKGPGRWPGSCAEDYNKARTSNAIRFKGQLDKYYAWGS